LCYNPVKAVHDKAFRIAAMDEAENALSELQKRFATPKRGRKPDPKSTMVKVAEILTKKGVKTFFEMDYDGQNLTYRHHEPALEKEALRDGKFVVKTNTQLPAAEVVLSYKTLMNVERAFREIKNFLEVRPLYHWNAKRVEGHIFICVLAYLFEQELQVLYRRHWQVESDKTLKISDETERTKKQAELKDCWFTGESIVKELARWNVFKGEFLGKTFLSVPPPTTTAQQILSFVGIPLPDKIIHLD
jgi:transposase